MREPRAGPFGRPGCSRVAGGDSKAARVCAEHRLRCRERLTGGLGRATPARVVGSETRVRMHEKCGGATGTRRELSDAAKVRTAL